MNTLLNHNMKIQIKKGDIIIIILVLFLAGMVFVFTMGAEQGEYVQITSKGEQKRYPLSEDQTIELTNGRDGYNTVVIENNEVHMEKASCPDQICVRHKAVSKSRESIICLPNEVYIEIESGKKNEIDN